MGSDSKVLPPAHDAVLVSGSTAHLSVSCHQSCSHCTGPCDTTMLHQPFHSLGRAFSLARYPGKNTGSGVKDLGPDPGSTSQLRHLGHDSKSAPQSVHWDPNMYPREWWGLKWNNVYTASSTFIYTTDKCSQEPHSICGGPSSCHSAQLPGTGPWRVLCHWHTV